MKNIDLLLELNPQSKVGAFVLDTNFETPFVWCCNFLSFAK
jgi:hypothetical protein